MIKEALLMTYLSVIGVNPQPKAEVPKYSEKEMRCLTYNIYYEAREEPFLGQLAVGLTTLRRVDSPKFPNTICKVVYAPSAFSWTHLVKNKVPKDLKRLALAKLMAEKAVSLYSKYNWRADHYHRVDVKPSWRKKMKKLFTIGQHIYYDSGLEW